MKTMSCIKFLILILISQVACADEGLFDLGLGVFNSGKRTPSETKFLALGIQDDLFGPWKTRGNVGGWIDNSGNGRSSSAFVGVQLGFEVDNKGIVGSVFTGPALITQTDSYLGGNFQFYNSLNLGFRDTNSNYIGIMYRHLSSAGIASPNVGRDVLGLELKWPF